MYTDLKRLCILLESGGYRTKRKENMNSESFFWSSFVNTNNVFYYFVKELHDLKWKFTLLLVCTLSLTSIYTLPVSFLVRDLKGTVFSVIKACTSPIPCGLSMTSRTLCQQPRTPRETPYVIQINQNFGFL